MDEERSSLCNCVVNFLLQERYLLTAFELLHELLEDGRHDQAIRVHDFFADPNLFPSDQIARFNSLRDPRTLTEEKETVEEKLAIGEYELCLAQEDLSRLKTHLQKLKESYPDGVNDHGNMLDILIGCKRSGCTFLVGGRKIDGVSKVLEDLDIPEELKDMFISMPEDKFCMDIYLRHR